KPASESFQLLLGSRRHPGGNIHRARSAGAAGERRDGERWVLVATPPVILGTDYTAAAQVRHPDLAAQVIALYARVTGSEDSDGDGFLRDGVLGNDGPRNGRDAG